MPLRMVWPRFLIGRDAEGRILLARGADSACAHLLLVGLGLRLDRDLDDGIGEFHALEHDRLVGIAQRVAGRRVLQAGQRDDVAGARFLDVFAVVRMHQQHAADALAVVLDRVEHAGAGSQHARIDAHEGQRADERVGHDLEGEAGERLVVRALALHLGSCRRRSVPLTAATSIGDGR